MPKNVTDKLIIPMKEWKGGRRRTESRVQKRSEISRRARSPTMASARESQWGKIFKRRLIENEFHPSSQVNSRKEMLALIGEKMIGLSFPEDDSTLGQIIRG
jgi:predicted nucleotidyltransferase